MRRRQHKTRRKIRSLRTTQNSGGTSLTTTI